jgi:hypothetical protein
MGFSFCRPEDATYQAGKKHQESDETLYCDGTHIPLNLDRTAQLKVQSQRSGFFFTSRIKH